MLADSHHPFANSLLLLEVKSKLNEQSMHAGNVNLEKPKPMLRYVNYTETQAGKAIPPAPRLADNIALSHIKSIPLSERVQILNYTGQIRNQRKTYAK